MELPGNPFSQDQMKEKMLDLQKLMQSKGGDVEAQVAAYQKKVDEEMKESMELFNAVSEVFTSRGTSLPMSYIVLAAMADAVFAYMIYGNENDDKE